MEATSLEAYLSNSVEKIIKQFIKASGVSPQANLFMLRHGIESKTARAKRKKAEQQGDHIPPFLIASITNQCNLHCKGCYARATNGCVDHACQSGLMNDKEWDSVFTQAEALGVEFILLAGGEPFVRRDVLSLAGKHKKLLFPVFTNGTMIDDAYLSLLSQNRNLMPVLSIEGNEATTDARRGNGVYQTLQGTMKRLKEESILFGASITVTRQNADEVLSDAFLSQLQEAGVKGVVYVEYVPMDEQSCALALSDADRRMLEARVRTLRSEREHMVFLSFPGDEKGTGGCLAAGRGFFHINAYGGAEPCPFSPYTDTNIRDTTLLAALHSPLFTKLQQSGSLTEAHIGGCALFAQKEKVAAMLAKESV